MRNDQEWESGFSKTCDSCFQALVTKPALVGSAQMHSQLHLSISFSRIDPEGFWELGEISAFLWIASALKKPQFPAFPSTHRKPEYCCWKCLRFLNPFGLFSRSKRAALAKGPDTDHRDHSRQGQDFSLKTQLRSKQHLPPPELN